MIKKWNILNREYESMMSGDQPMISNIGPLCDNLIISWSYDKSSIIIENVCPVIDIWSQKTQIY